MRNILTHFFAGSLLLLGSVTANAQYQMEKLNRGVVAIRTGNNNFISWRFLGNEEDNTTFNLYRNGTKITATPLNVTNYTDNGAASTSQYYVRAVVGGTEQSPSETVSVWGQNYLQIPLQIPAGGTTPSGENYTYSANDCSVGDVDGDGIYEIFVKWDPSNAKDNSQAGYTGNVYIDAYRLNGTRLWRINLGRNIRAGAHYTQFQVYDFNSDGKAELMVKTSDATIDGTGKVIGNANADYRNSSGYVLTGPEFLTVFNGQTGAAMATVNYLPGRGTVSAWGDSYGNRVDRFNAGVAYLDGKKPSAIFCRGYYTRLTVAAWDWNGTNLTSRWIFDSGNNSSNAFYGQGNHSISIADVDADGKQEIITGAAVIDDNGTGLYSTGFGHGDAGHVSDFDPSNPGLEVFNIQERDDDDDCYLYSPSQKRVIWKKGTTGGEGPGRGVMANITDEFAGAEAWIAGGQAPGSPWRINGNSMGTGQPASCNFLLWWDGDLPREISNGTTIDKYGTGRLLTTSGTASNNGSKSTPSLSGDILGDWREEMIVRTSDNSALRIYSTTTPTTYKIRTLLHDAQYRVALAWQNSSYNQPPHPSFFLGANVALPPKPNITIVGGTIENKAPVVSITLPANNATFASPASITINATATDADGTITKVDFYNGTTLIGSDNTSAYSFAWNNVTAGTYTLTVKAMDNAGAETTSSPITVTVTSNNTPPTVAITSPTNNTILSGTPTTIDLTATASDANGSVAKVEFYNGTTLLGSDASSPYSFSWTNVEAGTYTLTAIATDNEGTTATSVPVVITVQEQPSDCNGTQNGTASKDICDRCVGGTTGKAACTSVFEAEKACFFEGVEEATNEGFSGEGYVNVPNATGAYMTFIIAAANTGNATISLRYANGGTADRPGQLTINNTTLQNAISFPATGSWIDWEVLEVTLPLISGNNIIKLSATTTGGLANIDQIGLVSSGITTGDCGLLTGLDDEAMESHVALFPNPSVKDFNLVLTLLSDIKVMNAQGITIEQTSNKDQLQFGADYPAGVYFVQITTNGNSTTYRIVKN